jgi:hypothetical protein
MRSSLEDIPKAIKKYLPQILLLRFVSSDDTNPNTSRGRIRRVALMEFGHEVENILRLWPRGRGGGGRGDERGKRRGTRTSSVFR